MISLKTLEIQLMQVIKKIIGLYFLKEHIIFGINIYVYNARGTFVPAYEIIAGHLPET